MDMNELEQKYRDLEQRVSRIESCLQEENERRKKFHEDIEKIKAMQPQAYPEDK